LEAIVHPPMRSRFQAVIDHQLCAEGGTDRCVVLDAAVLLEAGWDDLCDLVVFIDAPREARVRRVEEQRGWSREMFEARERAQWPVDEKRRRADLVITNDAGVESLEREVDRVEAVLADLSCPVIETAN
jgi:dephospho-CoA kinase